MKRAWMIVAVFGGAALAQTPRPVLSLAVNGKRTADVVKGWPLLVRVTLMHSERLNRAAGVPDLRIAPAGMAWPDAIALRVRDGNGAVVSWTIPLLQRPEQDELILPNRSYVEVEWAMESDDTAQLTTGEYVIEANLSVRGSPGWNGAGSSSPARVRIVEDAEQTEITRASRELLRAELELRRGDAAKAAVWLDALLLDQPNETRALRLRAEIAEQAGEIGLGLALASQAVRAAQEKQVEAVEPPVELIALRNRLLSRLLQ